MPCMKCGAKMKNSGVFCENCLADMEKYPVKSNITVHIPERPVEAPVRKRTRRVKYTKPEDQIRHLKNVRNWLIGLLLATILAFAGACMMIFHLLDGEPIDLGIGQNYETVDSTDET